MSSRTTPTLLAQAQAVSSANGVCTTTAVADRCTTVGPHCSLSLLILFYVDRRERERERESTAHCELCLLFILFYVHCRFAVLPARVQIVSMTMPSVTEQQCSAWWSKSGMPLWICAPPSFYCLYLICVSYVQFGCGCHWSATDCLCHFPSRSSLVRHHHHHFLMVVVAAERTIAHFYSSPLFSALLAIKTRNCRSLSLSHFSFFSGHVFRTFLPVSVSVCLCRFACLAWAHRFACLSHSSGYSICCCSLRGKKSSLISISVYVCVCLETSRRDCHVSGAITSLCTENEGEKKERMSQTVPFTTATTS